MGDVLLRLLRRKTVNALIYRGDRSKPPEYRFVEPCSSFEQSKAVPQRGCLLWIPCKSPGAASQYATLDVEHAKFGEKMVVHDLMWLLGKEEVQRLRTARIYKEGELFMLKQWRSESNMRLHQLLWRLQGYLAESKPASSEQHE